MLDIIRGLATCSELKKKKNLLLCGSSHELCWFSFHAPRPHELRADVTSI